MQNASVLFKQLAVADVRPIRVDVFIDFSKTYNSSLPGVQDWDKYTYQNYSQRIVSVEWVREQNEYASLAMAQADIVLDNHDDYFTPNGSSPIASQILPGRPIKIYSGFSSEVVQSFVGLTEGYPIIDEVNKTITLHALDFFSLLLNTSVDETSIYLNKRADEIIRTLLNNAGILDVQLDLSNGLNVIPFVYVKKGQLLSDLFFKLVEAEGGRLFMSADGVITFRNRQDYSTDVKMFLSPYRNIVSTVPISKDELINVVQIKGNIRTEQPLQPYAQLTQPIRLGSGESKDVWISFPDPVTSADDPVNVLSATTSRFTTNVNEDGSGVSTNNIVLSSSTLFADSMKLTFTNNGTGIEWITEIIIFATPALVTQEVYVREEDSTSTANYNERILDIENDFFGDLDNATSKALIILRTFAETGEISQLEIKGDPTLELDDAVEINMYGVVNQKRVIRIVNKYVTPGKYLQIIKVAKLIENANYFTIEVSAIGGADPIAP